MGGRQQAGEAGDRRHLLFRAKGLRLGLGLRFRVQGLGFRVQARFRHL